MKLLKIKKKTFNLRKNADLKKLIDKYYKIKTLTEHLETERQALRSLIILILLMEEKGIKNIDTGKYYVELQIQEQAKLNIDEIKKTLPKEQLQVFETKLQTKALKILPKNEEERVKEVIKEYPKVFKNA